METTVRPVLRGLARELVLIDACMGHAHPLRGTSGLGGATARC